MMRSMYSGVAGLKTHQTKMDVIGNNIANVNTVGFKSQSITFAELMYQTTQAAAGANAVSGTGGTNAKQIGLGVNTGAINTAVSTPGATQTTGNPFDLRITGDAFFIANDGTQNYFTKAGAFGVDGAGNLVMATTGYNIMGWHPDPADETVIQKDTVKPLRIMSPENMTAPPEATTRAQLSGVLDKFNPNVNGTEGAIVTLEFYDNLGYSYTARFSLKSTATPGAYNMKLEDVLDSDKNSVGTTGVNFGTAGTNQITIFFDTDLGTFKGISASNNATTVDTQTVNGQTVNVKAIDLDLSNLAIPNQVGVAGSGQSVQGNFTTINIDMSTSKWYDNEGRTTLSATPGVEENKGKGKPVGKMNGVSITPSGLIYGTYTNGSTKLLGQIAVATFANAMGLEKVGENLYAATLNSGEFDGIGQDVSSDGGKMSTGVLEMSNVDLSTEFTEMIVTQRGFQANSRIITVSDTLLEELINLKR